MIIKTVKYLQEAIDIFKSRVEDLWPRFVMVDILRRAGGRSERTVGWETHWQCEGLLQS